MAMLLKVMLLGLTVGSKKTVNAALAHDVTKEGASCCWGLAVKVKDIFAFSCSEFMVTAKVCGPGVMAGRVMGGAICPRTSPNGLAAVCTFK